mmetsp:Transcript_37768/g.72350  ORF Transcript_37768/g.72350 Transcript_37768/m.72350 type:complete len:205 (+) Transcript_37768:1243-1857(+)
MHGASRVLVRLHALHRTGQHLLLGLDAFNRHAEVAAVVVVVHAPAVREHKVQLVRRFRALKLHLPTRVARGGVRARHLPLLHLHVPVVEPVVHNHALRIDQPRVAVPWVDPHGEGFPGCQGLGGCVEEPRLALVLRRFLHALRRHLGRELQLQRGGPGRWLALSVSVFVQLWFDVGSFQNLNFAYNGSHLAVCILLHGRLRLRL